MSDGLTPAQIDEIEATALAALRCSPQGWTAHPVYDTFDYYVADDGLYLGACPDCGVRSSFDKEDATHIATFDPPTALALVAEVRELRAKVERVRELHRENAYPDRPVSRCRDCDDVWPCETARALGEEA